MQRLICFFSKVKIKESIRDFLIVLIITLSLANLLWFNYSHNPVGLANEWLKEPETAHYLKMDNELYRIIDIGSSVSWNMIFNEGWKNNQGDYLSQKNTLAANMNLLFDISNFSSYSGLQLKKSKTLKNQIENGIAYREKSPWEIKEEVLSVLGRFNVKYLISPFELVDSSIKKVYETGEINNFNFFVYENEKNLRRTYVVKDLDKQQLLDNSATEIKEYKDLKAVVKVELDQEGFLILADTYYPGWQAYVDGKKQEILQTDSNLRALALSKGVHEVVFQYEPRSFFQGISIAFCALLMTLLLSSYFGLKKVLYSFGHRGVETTKLENSKYEA